MSALLSALNNKQQEAVMSTDGPVLVLAGAGSGKTRTLAHRIAYLIAEKKVPAWNILAVTFTNKAASEMRERVAGLIGVEERAFAFISTQKRNLPLMGTFHSICARVLREDGGSIGLPRSFAIYDGADQISLIKRVMKDIGYSPHDVNPNKILAAISSAKSQLISPDKFIAEQNTKIARLVADIYARYQAELKNAHAADFDDLIMKTVELWREHSDILEKYQERWQYLLIDEYQDINYAQYMWARLIAGPRQNIFAVGDDCQAIYRWRGADYKNILNFENDYPNARVILLEQNYRSTKRILNLGNTVIRENQFQKRKKLWTENGNGGRPVVAEVENEYSEAEFILRTIFKASVGEGFKPSPTELVYEYEGDGILDKILRQNSAFKSNARQFHKTFIPRVEIDISRSDIHLNDYAVLYRTNAQSRVLEEVLLSYGVPYRLIGGIKFYERREVKDMIAFLRLVANPFDAVSLERIINVPARGIGAQSLKLLHSFAKEKKLDFIESSCRIGDFSKGVKAEALRGFGLLMRFFKDSAETSVNLSDLPSFIDLIWRKTGYYDFLNDGTEEGKGRVENIKELKSATQKYAGMKIGAALDLFLEESALMMDIDSYDDMVSALTLMTAHSAKGLEFACVFMVGMEDGLFPHSASMYSPDELEEERRLCYVGITRAKERLYMLHARARMLYGSTMFNLPSQFIRDLADEHVERVYWHDLTI